MDRRKESSGKSCNRSLSQQDEKSSILTERGRNSQGREGKEFGGESKHRGNRNPTMSSLSFRVFYLR